MLISKVVLPAAGKGTRLLPATKEQPKEMLPLFAVDDDNKLCLKPVLQLIFEQLFDYQFRQFCFVVGRTKRAIGDHFTIDHNFLDHVNKETRMSIDSLYQRIQSSSLVWTNQSEPRGFGDAVNASKPFVGRDPFVVHAGDTYIPTSNHLADMVKQFSSCKPGAVLLLKSIDNPKNYGIAEGTKVEHGLIKIKRVVEKPLKPASSLAMMPIYIFSNQIFECLSDLSPGLGGEIQLTDAIQRLIDMGEEVFGVIMDPNHDAFDIGTPSTYWASQKIAFEIASKNSTE